MKKFSELTILASALCLAICLADNAQAARRQKALVTEKRDISMEQLRDKIRGGWAGQMIGVTYGAKSEFLARGTTFTAEIHPEKMDNTLSQDDLYVEMTFAKVMDTQGINAPASAYGKAFAASRYNLWHANAAARRNLARGIQPPMSGNPKYNAHADDIDFQIEADFIGLMCPGLPQTSNELGSRVGHVMNFGDGVYGGLFVSGMYAAAYFESKDMQKIVNAGLACLPEKSKYANIIRDVLEAWQTHPDNWQYAWQMLHKKWDNNEDLCPEGAMDSLNIDAKYNGAYIAVGLLYGGGDLQKTLEITTRCGQDSDCNPSSAVGILGVMKGYSQLPENYRKSIEELKDQKFAFTDYSFTDICTSTENRTIKAVKAAGGKLDPTGTTLTVALQKPEPAPLEQWNPGRPAAIIKATDQFQWKYKGDWKTDEKTSYPMTTAAGAEATFEFEGTGVVVTGVMSTQGGQADVFVDGKKHPIKAQAWVPENTWDGDLWREWNLPRGKHTIRLVTLPRAKSDLSTNTVFILDRAVIYKR